VDVELSEEHYRAVASEAERRHVTVQSLVERMTQQLMNELEQEERDGTDQVVQLS
jgi:hypothetical protein